MARLINTELAETPVQFDLVLPRPSPHLCPVAGHNHRLSEAILVERKIVRSVGRICSPGSGQEYIEGASERTLLDPTIYKELLLRIILRINRTAETPCPAESALDTL